MFPDEILELPMSDLLALIFAAYWGYTLAEILSLPVTSEDDTR